MKYQSKVNRHVHYESKTSGSFKYVQLYWKGIRPLITTHRRVRSIRASIARAEAALRAATQYEDLQAVLVRAMNAIRDAS